MKQIYLGAPTFAEMMAIASEVVAKIMALRSRVNASIKIVVSSGGVAVSGISDNR